MNVVVLSDLPEFRHDHLTHQIPLGALVDIEFDHCFHSGDYTTKMKGTARLVVVKHVRDCDGTPLYVMSPKAVIPPSRHFEDQLTYEGILGMLFSNYSEESLKDSGERLPLETWEAWSESLR